jgi:hypothetical protein
VCGMSGTRSHNTNCQSITRIQNKQEMRTKIAEKEAELNESRAFHERQLEALNAELARRSQLVEELENQMEDLRLQSNKQRKSAAGSKRLETSASTYQIDDATLRQLFMSYLLADRDKQPEIATVMASILGYSQEEQSLIQETFAADGIGSWFGFTGRKSGGGQRKEPSLTEQFIRFLETESRTIDEQPTLPIPQVLHFTIFDFVASG